MNQAPLIFLGLFAALATSWFGMIVQPQLQFGRSTPGANVVNTSELYPQPRAGLAQRGLEVYRSLGCVSCHSQAVRQDGTLLDVILTSEGTNSVAVVEAIRKLQPGMSSPEAGRILSSLPATLLEGLTDPGTAEAARTALTDAGAKAQVQLVALGPDIARGWGQGRTVGADFLYDRVALPGQIRLGPDLANVGMRLPSADWHYRHLYDPQAVTPESLMPPYRFLFERRKVGAAHSPDALNFNPVPSDKVIVGARTNWISGAPSSPQPLADEYEVVPNDDARALVAYLLSLKAAVPLFERPLAGAIGGSPKAPESTNGPAATPVTNAPPAAASTNSPAS
jgi:cytochrome c oxidase cbb3-type subunit 2